MISACDGERWELATGQEVYVSRTHVVVILRRICVFGIRQTNSQAKTQHVSIANDKMC